MELSGEYRIDAPREAVWAALNDPEMLQKSIPGCESMERVSDTEFTARIMAAIGPVRARFTTSLSLEDLDPPSSYRLVGESKAAQGFARGGARVTLEEDGSATLLRYVADFNVGGKLAQVGSRLVAGATRKTADEFFGTFSRSIDPGAAPTGASETPAGGGAMNRTWLAIGGALVVLLIWWFLLR